MTSDSYIEDKTKEEILADLKGTAEPRSVVHEQQKMAIIVRCTQDLEKSLKNLEKSQIKSSDSMNKLSNRLFWLEIILVAATIVGAIATAKIAFGY
ncbi:MAG: hypothetical protein KAT65_18245 [Methanophagales archaeon]|nr:hypothetical protein [Methanophagales archaeon]